MPHGDSPRHARKPKKARSPRSQPKPRTKPRTKPGPATTAESAPKAAAGKPSTSAIPSYDASIRLQKLLAGAGFGSRRDVERYLTEERVTVNGRTAKLGDRADPALDDIRFDGERLSKERPAYWIVNKPRGVLTTVRDEVGRRTVVDLVPPTVGRLFPVGRLDKETSGLILMTNDGDVGHALLHPSLGNEREYRVNVKGQMDQKGIGRLERGIQLEEGKTAGVRVSDVRFDAESKTSSLTLTLVEGKKRQIRRSLLVLGFPVRRLVRVRMGPLRLGRLAVGESRALRSEERRALLEHVRRLRAGEPVAASARTGAVAREDIAAPPRARETRRTRGATSSGTGRGTGAKRGAKRSAKKAGKKAGKRASKKRASRKSSAKRLGRGSARTEREDTFDARPGSKPGTRPAARPGTRPGTKPGARRGPGKPPRGPRQRTAASRKGVRR